MRTSQSPCLQCLLAHLATLETDLQRGGPGARCPSSLQAVASSNSYWHVIGNRDVLYCTAAALQHASRSASATNYAHVC